MTRPLWSPNDLTILRAGWHDDTPLSELSRLLGRSAMAISVKAHRLGLPLRQVLWDSRRQHPDAATVPKFVGQQFGMPRHGAFGESLKRRIFG